MIYSASIIDIDIIAGVVRARTNMLHAAESSYHCSDGGCVVPSYDSLQVICQVVAPRRLALRVGHVREGVGVHDVVDEGQHVPREGLAIRKDAADTYP